MPSRSAQRRTQDRVREMQRAERARERRRQGLMVGAVAVAVAAIVGVLAWQVAAGRSQDTTAGIKTFTGLSRGHVAGKVNYAQSPPVGGKHAPVPLNCGIYQQPVPAENAVHSLEHGAVWIAYHPDLQPNQVVELQGAARGHDYVIVSPYPGLPAPVVASAWGTQLRLQSAVDPRLDKFLSTFEEGRQTPEPGAACRGGVGNPTS